MAREAAPVVREPVAREVERVARAVSPVAREAVPVAREAAPVAREAAPVAREAVAREVERVARAVSPVAREAAPAARDARVGVSEAVRALDALARVAGCSDAGVAALDVRGVADRLAGVGAGSACCPCWAQARAASMVPAPMAAATGHSISPKAASSPSPP
ncbi:hypothetical protein GCM10022226_70130 [Sphaerisporangium flaviroseum]|uniref:Uncharacterized protein n=1 Tax=Sphaerisporangium flaviroseum TaxID=509199 RepID=A0ABP7J8R3_9ACTN